MCPGFPSTGLTLDKHDEIFSKLSRLFDAMMRTLHNQHGTQFRIEILESDEAQQFIRAHADTLDSSFRHVPMSDAMRRRLQRSDYIFSGIKTFHECNQAFPSLIDENGNRKPFEQFLNDVRKIDQTYNQHYLRAEYNFCQASADMAAKWEQFTKDGERYNLQYRTQRDEHVRPEHRLLDRITLPISDTFWEKYYPPNGWNCRCTVVQVRKSKYPVTPHDQAMALAEEATGKDIKGIFQFNPGIEQKTFPDYNPYTISRCRDCDVAKGKLKLDFVPSNQLCQGCQLLQQCYGNLQKSENAVTKKHYLTQMEPLKQRKVTVNGNGHQMTVGFRQDGNKHLYNDAYKGKIEKEELMTLDQMLQNATFITKAGLSKPRPNDDIKRFYYYQAVNRKGQVIFLNVAETDYIRSNGKIYHNRFLYSITHGIKE